MPGGRGVLNALPASLGAAGGRRGAGSELLGTVPGAKEEPRLRRDSGERGPRPHASPPGRAVAWRAAADPEDELARRVLAAGAPLGGDRAGEAPSSARASAAVRCPLRRRPGPARRGPSAGSEASGESRCRRRSGGLGRAPRRFAPGARVQPRAEPVRRRHPERRPNGSGSGAGRRAGAGGAGSIRPAPGRPPPSPSSPAQERGLCAREPGSPSGLCVGAKAQAGPDRTGRPFWLLLRSQEAAGGGGSRSPAAAMLRVTAPSAPAPAPAPAPDYWIDGSNRDALGDFFELESELGR